ncbi:MAG: hypothetical protein D6788_08670 [Planctomycetota bacterium]|nr:MAG: hypothetical protein D6788_08670 [Planctomycetota bacterium]
MTDLPPDEERRDRPHEAAGWFDLPPGARVWIGGHDTALKKRLHRLLAGFSRPSEGPLHAAFLTPKDEEEAAYFARKLRPRLAPRGRLWILRPRGDGHGPAGEKLTDLLARAGYRPCDSPDLPLPAHACGFTPAP